MQASIWEKKSVRFMEIFWKVKKRKQGFLGLRNWKDLFIKFKPNSLFFMCLLCEDFALLKSELN